MAALPTVGSDIGVWGTELNNYLSVGHGPGGQHPFMAYAQEYQAVGDGVTDDTVPLQNAINAVQNAGGGRVVISRPHLISSTLVVSANNVEIEGTSWAAQLIAAPGFSATPMLQVQRPGTDFRYGIRIAGIFLNGSSITGGVGGLDLQSCYGALVDHVRTRYLSGIAVHWNGASGQFGAYNYLRDCHITDGIGASAVGVQTDSSEWLTIAHGHIGYYQTSGNVAVKLQNLNNRVLGTSFDYCDTSVQCSFAGRNHIIGCQFDRGWNRFIYLQSAASCTVNGNFFGVLSGSGTDIIRADGVNNDKSVITSNSVQATSGWTNFYKEYSGIGGVNTIANNDTGALPLVLLTGRARGNTGYNPVGSVTPPTFPATTVAATNTTGYDVTAYIANGTAAITVIQVAGVAGTYVTTGMQIAASGWGSVRIPAGGSVKFTYASGTPTWTWMGE